MSNSKGQNQRTRKVRRGKTGNNSISKQILNLSETKRITENCHHFPLNSIANMTYSDSGIFIGGWTCTNRIVQGTGNNQRIGNSMKIFKIEYIFSLYAPTVTPDTIRIFVIRDIAPKGTWPALADMFDNPNNNLTCISPNCRHQYKIIYDAYIDIGSYMPVRTHRITLKLGTDTRYVGAGPNLVDIENGAIYIMAISVNGFTSSEVLNFWSTLSYKDL